MSFDNISVILEQITQIIDQEDEKLLEEKINQMHEADAAELIELLSPSYRRELMKIIGAKLNPVILTYLDETVREAVIDLWAQHELVAALSKVDEYDALELLSEFTQEERRSLLRTLKPELRIALEESFSYSEETAGRLMQHEFVALPTNMLACQAAAFLHSLKNQSLETNIVFLVDEKRKPVAEMSFAQLILAQANQTLLEISKPLVYIAHAGESSQEIALMFKKYFINSVPVVNHDEKLVGIIQLNNIIDVVYEQAEEGFLQSAGVDESDFYKSLLSSISSRLKWIVVAGLYSLISAWIISIFQDVIEKHAIIPALNQVLLAATGTAGMQAVTVTTRALLGRDLISVNTFRAIRKETMVGVINGLILAPLLSAFLFFHMFKHPAGGVISIIFGVSIFLGTVAATLAGAVIPILLTKLKVDPSISASPLLASFADAAGLLIIFSLARILL